MKNQMIAILALSVCACGDPMFWQVGSACATITDGRVVGAGPTYSTVWVGAPKGCTGTYIAPGVVLSAAHCGTPERVGIGDEVRDVALLVPHPAFDLPDNDLMIIFLEGELSVEIARLGLPEYGAALIQGFGMDETQEAGTLREGNVHIDEFWAPNSLAIMTPPGDPDTCFGDSGGPLYQRGELVAVTTLKLPLDPAPATDFEYCGKGGVYTIVGKFRAWLDSEVANLDWVSSCGD